MQLYEGDNTRLRSCAMADAVMSLAFACVYTGYYTCTESSFFFLLFPALIHFLPFSSFGRIKCSFGIFIHNTKTVR